MTTFEYVSVGLDSLTLLLLALFWRHRVRLAQKVLDMPMPGEKKSDYRVVSSKPGKVYYAGSSLREAKRIRDRERRNGIQAVLMVNGQYRN